MGRDLVMYMVCPSTEELKGPVDQSDTSGSMGKRSLTVKSNNKSHLLRNI